MPPPSSARPGRHPERRFHLACAFAYTLACVGWTLWAGRDQNWDLFNYHLYVAQAWWQGRLPGEIFAAGAQGYLNPLAHLPYFAAFVASDGNNLAVALAVAVLHSTNLWLLHAIASRLIPPTDRLQRLLLVAGVVLGGLTPAFLLETGTSFTDIVVSIPSLAAVLCILRWMGEDGAPASRRWGSWWLAAFLAGVAVGLKPSALVFSAALMLAVVVSIPLRLAWAASWRAALGGLAGMSLVGGPHALMLWQAFGNPVFPLFNGVFHSPWFADANAVSDRFRPSSLTDALWYPLRLADPFSRAGFESIAADIRPLALIVLGPLLLAPLGPRARSARPPGGALKFVLIALAGFLPFWIYTSGNTRYALQALLLIGPAIAALTVRMRGRSAIWPLLLIGLLVTMQGVAAFTLNRPRMDGRDWSQTHMDIRIPAALRTTPAYFLSLQLQSYSVLAGFVHPQSRLTNLVGQNTLSPSGLAWRAVIADRAARGLPWRTLATPSALDAEGGIPRFHIDTQNALLSEYGLRVDPDDCEFIDVDGSGRPALHWVTQVSTATRPDPLRSAVVSCRIVEAPALPVAEAQRRLRVDARMDAWERRCPALFAPKGTHSQQSTATIRQRFYVNSDVWFTETSNRLFAVYVTRGRSLPLEDEHGRRLLDGCPPRPIDLIAPDTP